MVKNPPANAGDLGSFPGQGRSLGERNGNPLQDSCLGNLRDRGDWWTIVHGGRKSQTATKHFTSIPNYNHQGAKLDKEDRKTIALGVLIDELLIPAHLQN